MKHDVFEKRVSARAKEIRTENVGCSIFNAKKCAIRESLTQAALESKNMNDIKEVMIRIIDNIQIKERQS